MPLKFPHLFLCTFTKLFRSVTKIIGKMEVYSVKPAVTRLTWMCGSLGRGDGKVRKERDEGGIEVDNARGGVSEWIGFNVSLHI